MDFRSNSLGMPECGIGGKSRVSNQKQLYLEAQTRVVSKISLHAHTFGQYFLKTMFLKVMLHSDQSSMCLILISRSNSPKILVKFSKIY